MPVFPEIEAITLTDRVAAALKDAFFSGKLKPGDTIIERQVAQEMKVGTPVVREALICLQGQGFVRRVTNTGTFVTKFSSQEVTQLYTLRIELEALALGWARPRVSAADLAALRALVDDLVEAGESGTRRQFLERDFVFHKRCWELSGNVYLVETLERLMAPLFAFVVLASDKPMTGAMAREHYQLVDALGGLQPPEFDKVVRTTLSVFSQRWISSMASKNHDGTN
jgi:DNA-binding GntR family transcriptional regulator